MALNLTKTYSQKSNAQADVRKAVKKGEAALGEFTVVSLSGGFRIVPAVTQAPTSGSSTTGFEPVNEDEDVIDSTEAFTSVPEPTAVPPGLARLRADANAETIRESVLADNASATEELQVLRQELLADPKVTIGAGVMADYAVERRAEIEAKRDAPKRGRKVAGLRAPKAAPKVAAGGISPDAEKVLLAAFKVAADGWVDQKEIPHGLVGRAVSGFLAGLQRRGLIETRADKGGKFSARVTAAGVALAQGAGR